MDRLVLLSGEFQRLALSTTIKPLETAAAFVGGYQINNGKYEPTYQARDVAIVQSDMDKQYDLTIRLPEEARVSLRIELPKGGKVEGPIVISARCVWSLRGDQPGTFFCGYEFLEAPKEGEIGIAELYLRRSA